EVLDDCSDRLDADLIGKLDRICVDLALFDRLLALRLAVERDDLNMFGFAGLFQRCSSAKTRRAVDCKDGRQVRMRLDEVFGRFISFVLRTLAIERGDDFDLALARGLIMRFDDFLETLDPKLAGLNDWEIQNGDLPARVSQQLDHRLARFFTATKVI